MPAVDLAQLMHVNIEGLFNQILCSILCKLASIASAFWTTRISVSFKSPVLLPQGPGIRKMTNGYYCKKLI